MNINRSDIYAREELVAELGAAFLCADLAITPEVRDDHTAYIQSWLKVLRRTRASSFRLPATHNGRPTTCTGFS